MRKYNLLFQISTIASMLVVGSMTYSIAQNADSDSQKQKLKIDIEITENGETRRINKEVDAIEGEDIHQILRDLDIMDDIDITGTGERIEIKVRKEVHGDSDKNIDVNVFGPGSGSAMEKRPLLGVYLETHDQNGQKGARLTGVIPGSAAEKAELKEGDIITKLNGVAINSDEELRDAIGSKKIGEQVTIIYLRDGKTMTAVAELGESKNEHSIFLSTPNNGSGKHFYFKGDVDGEMEELMEQQLDEFNFNFDLDIDDDGAFLGVTPGDNSKDSEGVLLGEVISGSAAEKMGLKAGDKVLKLDGKEVNDFEELSEIIVTKKAGDQIEVAYQREGKNHSAKGELGKRSDNPIQKRVMRFSPDCHQGSDGRSPMIIKEVKVVMELKDCTKEDQEMLSAPAAVDFNAQLPLNKIEFAPNPSDGLFNLEFELPEKKDTRVLIFDQMGRKVYEELLSNFDGAYQNQIDISTQPNGTYFLIVAQDQKQFTKKIVKQ